MLYAVVSVIGRVPISILLVAVHVFASISIRGNISYSHTFSRTRSTSPVIDSWSCSIDSHSHWFVTRTSIDIHSTKSSSDLIDGTTTRDTVPLYALFCPQIVTTKSCSIH